MRKPSRRGFLAAVAPAIALPASGAPVEPANRIQTVEELAEIDFAPLSADHLEACRPPELNDLRPHLVSLRAAWRMLSRSKPQLIECVHVLGEEDFDATANSFAATIAELDRLLALMRQAEARFFSAAAVAAVDASPPLAATE